jgi:ribokinase
MTVYVIGNVTEDLVFRLPRLPREGETLLADHRVADIGGKGLNQALLLTRAGCPARLVAPIGRDDAGRRAEALAAEELAGAQLIKVDAPSDQSILYVAATGENTIVSSAQAARSLSPAQVQAALREVEPGDTLLVQGNLSAQTTAAALRRARDAGAFCVANPSPIQWAWTDLWGLLDLVVVNRLELSELAQPMGSDGAAATLLAAGVGQVLVTLGAEGAEFWAEDQRVYTPAAPVDVVDTAGAGDTFCSVFLAARLRGCPIEVSMRAASQAAARTIARAGTLSAFPDSQEIAACLAAAEAQA